MTRQFSRWLRKTALTESALCLAVTEMSNGLIDADMGGGVLKKRVAMPARRACRKRYIEGDLP